MSELLKALSCMELNLCHQIELQLQLISSAWHLCTGVEALNLAKWPIGGGQEQALMASLGHHMWRLTQLDLADSLVRAPHHFAWGHTISSYSLFVPPLCTDRCVIILKHVPKFL